MNREDACTLLEMLADGVDPMTGEILPREHVCREADVRRALEAALQALRGGEQPARDPMVNKSGRLNAGRPWSAEDLQQLKELHAAGASVEEMCLRLQRRRRGLEKQLALLERAAAPGGSRRGAPWSPEEDAALCTMVKQRCPPQDVARALGRTGFAVYCRMDRLGLVADAAGRPLPSLSMDAARQIRQLHAEGLAADEIAARVACPAEDVRTRLRCMGEEPGVAP